MLHTITSKNPTFDGPALHNQVHFHDGRALVDDALEVFYDTAEPGGEMAVLHPQGHNAIALLVEQGCTDLGPIYTDAAQAGLVAPSRGPQRPL